MRFAAAGRAVDLAVHATALAAAIARPVRT